MSVSEIIRAVLIHLVTPAFGLACYIWLCTRMHRRGIPEPPYITYVFLFSVLGGWLMILLTALFWYWSGMASIGALFLAFISPFVASVFALSSWRPFRFGLSPLGFSHFPLLRGRRFRIGRGLDYTDIVLSHVRCSDPPNA